MADIWAGTTGRDEPVGYVPCAFPRRAQQQAAYEAAATGAPQDTGYRHWDRNMANRDGRVCALNFWREERYADK